MSRKPALITFCTALVNPLKKKNDDSDVKSTLQAAQALVKNAGGRKKIKMSRIYSSP